LIVAAFAFSMSAFAGQCKISDAERQIGTDSGSGTNQEVFRFATANGTVYTVNCEFVPYMGGCACDPAQVND
jgi:hypothetical protein